MRLSRLEKVFLVLVILICGCLIGSRWFFNIHVISGSSMWPTLKNENVVAGRRFGLDIINRGDIVTVASEDGLVVKRVIGLPGEYVYLDSEGYVYVNDELLDDFQMPIYDVDYDTWDMTLGEDEYFIMGDNRKESYDSRFFGSVRHDEIIDIIVLRFWPLKIY